MAVSADLQSLLDSLDEPRLLIRSDYTVAYANRAFRRRFGGRDFSGRRCHELLFHELQPCGRCGHECPLDQAAATQRPASCLHRELIPGGERWLDLTATPIPGPDGSPVFFMERVLVRGDAFGFTAYGIAAKSEAVKACLAKLARVTAVSVPVLFAGESGSGKLSFARTLHENSRRAAHAFVPIGCEGLTQEAFEAELLGRKDGRTVGGGLVQSPGGTLYFEEVGALSLVLQRRLLELIETGAVRASGSPEAVAVDYRVFCGTSKNLRALVQEDRFRADLYYRLTTYRVDVPPLRDRLDDIEELAGFVLSGEGPGPTRLSPEALAYLKARVWPGNVRELESLVARARLFSSGDVLTRTALAAADEPSLLEAATKPLDASHLTGSRRRLTAADASAVRLAAEAWRGSRKALAEHFGLSERTLYRILKSSRNSDEPTAGGKQS